MFANYVVLVHCYVINLILWLNIWSKAKTVG